MTATRSLQWPTTAAVVAVVAMVTALAATPAPAADKPAPQANRAPAGPAVGKIAAVVNEDIITIADLNARVALALISTGLPDTQEARERLAAQVLRGLIDERLQLQEAKRQGISVSDEEVERGLARVAEQNRLQVAQLQKMFAERHVPVETMKGQIRASIAWSKLIQRTIQPTVAIGDEEINAAVERIRANAGKPEFLVAEIFLSVDRPDQDDDVHRLADRLVDQIRKGTSFSAVARQFSQSAGAASGGDLGWIQQGQLADDLDQVVRQLRPGQISLPVRSASGYHILFVRDQRAVAAGASNETTVHIKQIGLPTPTPATQAEQAGRLQQWAREVNDCAGLERVTKGNAQVTVNDMGEAKLGDLNPDLRQVVSRLPVGRLSPPFNGGKQVVALIVCERQDAPGGGPSREAVANALGSERLDMLQRRYMRDLRRAAFLEMRV